MTATLLYSWWCIRCGVLCSSALHASAYDFLCRRCYTRTPSERLDRPAQRHGAPYDSAAG